MAQKESLHTLIEQLPSSEVDVAERFLRFLLAKDEPPVDPAMLARIDAARANRSPGIAHEDVLREFGL